MFRLIRGYTFSAGHRLARADWDAERNRAVYGCCANPGGHGHDYRLELTIAGDIDPETGLICPVDALDVLVRERVLDPLDHRFLNDLALGPADAAPTAESLCRWIWEQLQVLPSGRLHRLRLFETDTNGFEINRATPAP